MARRVLLAAVLIVLAAPAGAHAAFTIETVGAKVSKIGPFKPRKDASVQAAVNAFGSPGSTTATKSGCKLEWVNFGLEIRFTSCNGDGQAQTFSTRSRRFRTWAGLRCGAAESEIPELHPAEKHGHWWWLQRGRLHPKDRRLLPVLRAHVTNKRVDRIAGWIGAKA
jgi:hypothetical protein